MASLRGHVSLQTYLMEAEAHGQFVPSAFVSDVCVDSRSELVPGGFGAPVLRLLPSRRMWRVTARLEAYVISIPN